MTTLCEQCGSASRDKAGFCRGCGAPPVRAQQSNSEKHRPPEPLAGSEHNTDPSYRSLDFGQLKEKSTRNAVVLTILFGPAGLFYCTLIGGLIMMALSLIALALGSLWASTILWFVSIGWAWWETRD